MKICVFFRPSEAKDVFEGKRLRKNIKGALELKNVEYSKNIIDTYDVLHCLSLSDANKINDAMEEGTPVVFSALMCESDDAAKLLSETREGSPFSLSAKALRVLNSVSLVIVNDAYARDFLIRSGVKTRIAVVSAGVKLSRFAMADPLQGEIFHNYFQLDPERKYVVTVGDHRNKAHVRTLVELARLLPRYSFFFFAPLSNYRKATLFSKLFRRIPGNVRISPLLSDELYCSMMHDASGYLVFRDSLPSPLTLLDAMASRTPIFAFLPQRFNLEQVRAADALTAENVTEMAELIEKVMEGALRNDLDKAYAFAKANSLRHVGDKLVREYARLLKEGKGHHDR